MRYAIVISKDEDSDYGVYCPDLKGCFSVGETVEEAVALFRDVAESHLDHLREMGQELPKPTTMVDTIEVSGVA